MLGKEITYPDLDGNPVTETFWFHLSKIELAEKDILTDGGYSAVLKSISETTKASVVYPLLKEVILDSVGRRSEDGKRFEKNASVVNDFVESAAYETLIFELLKDAKSASDFMNAIMPANLVKQAQLISGTLEQSEEKPKAKTLEEYSIPELTNMPYEQFETLVNSVHPMKLSKDILVLAMQRRSNRA